MDRGQIETLRGTWDEDRPRAENREEQDGAWRSRHRQAGRARCAIWHGQAGARNPPPHPILEVPLGEDGVGGKVECGQEVEEGPRPSLSASNFGEVERRPVIQRLVGEVGR